MKKNLALLAALALGICALVGCTKAIVNPEPEETLPHQGETAKAEDGSFYAVGETVTAANGDTQVAQPVTNVNGELVGVTLMTPEEVVSLQVEQEEESASRKALEEAEVSYTGRTNRQRITTTVVRATSPNHLTSRPTLPETEPRSAALSSHVAVETTVSPKKVKVSYPGTLSYTENGVTVKYQIEKYEASVMGEGAAVTLTVRPLSALREPVIVQIGYNCYDAAGNKLNEKTITVPAALNPNGSSTEAVAPLPGAAVRVEFFGN